MKPLIWFSMAIQWQSNGKLNEWLIFQRLKPPAFRQQNHPLPTRWGPLAKSTSNRVYGCLWVVLLWLMDPRSFITKPCSCSFRVSVQPHLPPLVGWTEMYLPAGHLKNPNRYGLWLKTWEPERNHTVQICCRWVFCDRPSSSLRCTVKMCESQVQDVSSSIVGHPMYPNLSKFLQKFGLNPTRNAWKGCFLAKPQLAFEQGKGRLGH